MTDGDANWQGLSFPTGDVYQWEPDSTYIRKAPYFDGMTKTPAPVTDIAGARVLAVLGDSVTTDHISPAGSIKANGPAGKYLTEHGVKPADFNSYGSRRGNHEVMVRGTFANVRLRNKLAPGTEGGVTRLLPEGEQMSIFDASVKYAERGVPLIILAGKEYGSGSSRDWAAKGPKLLGVRAVIAESFERIHRSNLVGMGILPLQFDDGQNAESLGLTGEEVYDFPGLTALLEAKFANGRTLAVKATAADGDDEEVQRQGPHRHAAGDRVLRARRHSAVRAAAAGGKVGPRNLPSPERIADLSAVQCSPRVTPTRRALLGLFVMNGGLDLLNDFGRNRGKAMVLLSMSRRQGQNLLLAVAPGHEVAIHADLATGEYLCHESLLACVN